MLGIEEQGAETNVLRHRINGVWNVYCLVLLFVFSSVFWGYLLSLDLLFQTTDKYNHQHYIMYYLVGLTGFLWFPVASQNASGRLLMRDWPTFHQLAFVQAFLSGVSILIFLVASKDLVISRVFLFSLIPILYFSSLLSHCVVPRWLLAKLFGGRNIPEMVLVGSVKRAKAIEGNGFASRTLGMGIKGFVQAWDEGDEWDDSLKCRKLGDVKSLESVLRRERVSLVLLLEIPRDLVALSQIVEATHRVGARLLVLNTLEDIFGRPVTCFQHHGLQFISLHEEPLENPVHQLLKRVIDIAVSLPVVIVILPPLTLIVWLLQRSEAPGPIFYRQTRSGKGNRPFRIFKFRTMYANRENSSKQATLGDARIFPSGSILRKTSLDELPQFLNVLLGHMSVVGPRPHLVFHERQFSSLMTAYKVRSFVKPGITGLAQVSGFRGEVKTAADVVQRVTFDIRYIESWSIWMDLKIIVLTAKQVLMPPKSAH